MDFKEIDHLLELARIELSSQEKEKIALDLGKILDYVRQLQELDTNNVEPMTCLLYTSPSPRDGLLSRMPSSA